MRKLQVILKAEETNSVHMCHIYKVKEMSSQKERKTAQKLFGGLSENNTSLELSQISQLD